MPPKYKLCAFSDASVRLLFLAVTCLIIFLGQKCPSFTIIWSKTEEHKGSEQAILFSASYTYPETQLLTDFKGQNSNNLSQCRQDWLLLERKCSSYFRNPVPKQKNKAWGALGLLQMLHPQLAYLMNTGIGLNKLVPATEEAIHYNVCHTQFHQSTLYRLFSSNHTVYVI